MKYLVKLLAIVLLLLIGASFIVHDQETHAATIGVAIFIVALIALAELALS